MCFGFAAEAQQLYDFLGRLFGLGSISARACFYIALAFLLIRGTYPIEYQCFKHLSMVNFDHRQSFNSLCIRRLAPTKKGEKGEEQ